MESLHKPKLTCIAYIEKYVERKFGRLTGEERRVENEIEKMKRIGSYARR